MKRVLSALILPSLVACGGDLSPDALRDAARDAADERTAREANEPDALPEDDGPGDNSPGLSQPDTPTAQTSALAACGGDLAEDTFRYGLCVCDDFAFAGGVYTSSFRSSQPGEPDGLGGGLGVNGDFSGAGEAFVGGSLVVGGDFAPAGAVVVDQELRVGGRLTSAGDADVATDAWVAGDVTSIGLRVDGTLHTTAPVATAMFIEAGATQVADFTVDAPCGCEGSIDPDVVIAEARAANDNEAAGIAADALSGVAGDAELTLPAGRYLLDGVAVAGDITIHAQGPVQLAIDGDLALAGRLEIALDSDDAEVDLFLGGDIATAGALALGSSERPAAVRTYVGGEGDITLAGEAELGGALWAPNATLAFAGEARLNGSAVVGRVAEAGDLYVRYDADLQEAGEVCLPPPGDEPDLDPPPGDGEPAPGDEPTPGDDEPTPGDEPPAPGDDGASGEPAEGTCVSFEDCPSPQQCVQGSCVFIDG